MTRALRGLTLSIALAVGSGPPGPTAAQDVAPADDPAMAAALLDLARGVDRGDGTARDPAEARRLYRAAGAAGSAVGQFNHAVMLDAGLGGPRDPLGALVWYARAAIRGHARARFNLALLLDDASGPAPNGRQAAFWYARAASDLPAAAGRVPTAPTTGPLAPPEIVFLSRRADAVEVVWTASPGPAAARLRLDALVGAGDRAVPVIGRTVEGSAAIVPLPTATEPVALRVAQVDDGGDYAASAWIVDGDVPPPEGLVRFEVEGAPGPRALADRLSGDLAVAGIWSRSVPPGGIAPGAVVYGHAPDAALAGRVAASLPLLGADDVRLDAGAGLAPGEVAVALGGGDRDGAAEAAIR